MEEYSISLKADTRKMMVVGNIPELGGWSLVKGVTLLQEKAGIIFKFNICIPVETRLEDHYIIIVSGQMRFDRLFKNIDKSNHSQHGTAFS